MSCFCSLLYLSSTTTEKESAFCVLKLHFIYTDAVHQYCRIQSIIQQQPCFIRNIRRYKISYACTLTGADCFSYLPWQCSDILLLFAQTKTARRLPFFLKGFWKSETMTKLKQYCLFLSSLTLPLTPSRSSLSFPLSSFNLCLSVFLIDTAISRRFHAWELPNGSALMTNRSIFIDLKVAGLENCLTIFKTGQSFAATISLSLSLGYFWVMGFIYCCCVGVINHLWSH